MRFEWPVGIEEERRELGKLPGAWSSATKYGQRYNATGSWAIHTGLDLNLNSPRFDADAHSPVYAAENGVVEFSEKLPVWGSVIVLKHIDEARHPLWTRYAHVEQLLVAKDNLVARGQQLARVGNADGRYHYHLHYDIAKIDLGEKPGDWPGDRLSQVLRDYIDPLDFMRDQLAGANGGKKTRLKIIAEPTLRVRAQPSALSAVLGRIATGEIVEAAEIRSGWVRIEKPVAGWILMNWTKPAG
jgi:murein DD-endopeptidase MepM/ murein hydrolase activator NlpD